MRDAHERVALLVEMRADDKARELHADAPLAGALRRFAAAGHRITPAGALGMGDRDLDVRVQRLLVADRPPRLLGATALRRVATILVALPITLFLSLTSRSRRHGLDVAPTPLPHAVVALTT